MLSEAIRLEGKGQSQRNRIFMSRRDGVEATFGGSGDSPSTWKAQNEKPNK